MGRSAGFIALEVGVGAGAEAVLIPETPTDLEAICSLMKNRISNGRTSNILVVAEGDEEGDAFEIARKIESISGMKSRITVLGHVQRGGSPTTSDRVLASKMGSAAVTAIADNACPCYIGQLNGIMHRHPFKAARENRKPLDPLLLKLTETLAT